MKFSTKLLSASAVAALAMLAVAAPSQAAVFADFNPIVVDANGHPVLDTHGNYQKSAVDDYSWANAGGAANNSKNGSFSTLTSKGAIGSLLVEFSFSDPALSQDGTDLLANFTASMSETGFAAIPPGGPGQTWLQQGLTNGVSAFSFTLANATVINGHSYAAGTNLLSGTLSDAWIQGAGGTGSTNVTIGNGGSLHFTSAVEPFTGLIPGSQEFVLDLGSVHPHFGAHTGDALESFKANGGGNFSFLAVPEPATWGLMLVGFGGMGAMLRRRRATAVAA
ncbi:PEPxxWA-CTERM sorting domain-containing protein [Phenylobacterium sp.]|uniref:PEPxxWA-CTERM sorting domain-containing protein n=1 Tax=Phenylobacterium sp. TaxID=1871053 RepID=UPI002BF4E100|nr:PEPxxWA-CTERM sorting domain-containing protein [Phenylobacterium sp.]HLZ75537.1 PEPxxWA-CTERM sorting domain-containing protein [Phenylobacterium sp.]